MPSAKTINVAFKLIIDQEIANVRARVFEQWGVNLDDVQVTAAPHDSITTDTELIPGVLWGGYSERLNTLVLRTT